MTSPQFDERLRALLEQRPYARFSNEEMARRRRSLVGAMQKMQVDHLLVCGEQRVGSGVAWLTGWPATTEALVVVSPHEKNVMFMEWYNHIPLAQRIALDTDVCWGEQRVRPERRIHAGMLGGSPPVPELHHRRR